MSQPTPLPLLDENTAYEAMKVFIEAYWDRGSRSSDDLAVLLGGLDIDPAMRSDWTDAVRRVLAKAADHP